MIKISCENFFNLCSELNQLKNQVDCYIKEVELWSKNWENDLNILRNEKEILSR
jgi:hypothetical protein